MGKPILNTTIITLSGDVIGVGMRRAVRVAALAEGLSGWVANIRRSVEMVAQGRPERMGRFLSALRSDMPGRVDHVTSRMLEAHPLEPGFDAIDKAEHLRRLVRLEFGDPEGHACAAKAFERAQKIHSDAMVQAYRAAPSQPLLDELLRRNFAPDSVARRAADLSAVSSLRKSIYLRSRTGQLVPDDYTGALNIKRAMHWLADALGVKRPKTTAHFKLDDLEAQISTARDAIGEKFILKPAHSFASTGVYLATGEGFYSFGRSKMFNGLDALRGALAEDMASGKLRNGDWYFEQPIFGDEGESIPANDIKFWSFYGEIGVAMEVSRYPEKVYCWWSEDGRYIKPGPYRRYYKRPLSGFTKPQADIARKISLSLPLPFIRLDFLRDARGDLYFGEFGTKPGYFSNMDDETDRLLGEKYLAASARLHRDLLDGKKFDAFNSFRKTFG